VRTAGNFKQRGYLLDELMNEPYEYDENSNLNRSPDYNRVSIVDDFDQANTDEYDSSQNLD